MRKSELKEIIRECIDEMSYWSSRTPMSNKRIPSTEKIKRKQNIALKKTTNPSNYETKKIQFTFSKTKKNKVKHFH